jgi:hypothetical protein
MTIEIHQPELEALIQQRMASGRFQTIEDFLLATIKSAPTEDDSVVAALPKETLEQMFAKVRGLLTDDEIDTLFCRDPSPGRTVDFS